MGPMVRAEAAGFKCPVCNSDVQWHCWGDTGLAFCTWSLEATRDWSDLSYEKSCSWSGRTKRAKCGKVMILYRLGRQKRR